MLPDGAYLSINASPATVVAPEFLDAIDGSAGAPLVVEVTEHAAVTDYEALLTAVDRLTSRGVRLAIDDAGTGFSGLHQILRLRPDIIKIDVELVRDLDTSPDKQAMSSALASFAARVGTTLVAEGIDSAAELATLRVLRIHGGQGCGRPASTSQAAVRWAACQSVQPSRGFQLDGGPPTRTLAVGS